MTPRLYRVIVPVADLDKAKRFYEGLFELKGERVSAGRHYLNLSGTILAIYDPVADGDATAEWRLHPNQYLYVGIANLEGAFQRATHLGATLVTKKIETMPWGERLFYLKDPFGNQVCLVDERTLFLGSEVS